MPDDDQRARTLAISNEADAIASPNKPQSRRRLPFRPHWTAGMSTVAWNIGALVVFLLTWQVASAAFASTFFPGPKLVTYAFYELCARGDLQGHLLSEGAVRNLVGIR